jgi:Ca2+-binding RTX toxin-like protein
MMRLLRPTGLLLGLLLLALASAPPAGAAPSCAEGPQTVGDTIVGTPCDDTIHAPRGIGTVLGEGGNDSLFGGRGNDSLFGGEGDDRLYGGVGDDRVRGGPGDDLLSGGFGADSLDGEAGNDLDRGDATVDELGDSGGGTDTLSFATGATPGFPNPGAFFEAAGFPSGAEGRGVYVDLGDDFANDGLAPSGGGVDKPLAPETTFGNFEVVIGTPFDDYIVGTSDSETFYGGGGADLIDGGGGADVAYGGAEGDGCIVPVAGMNECEFSGEEIQPRDPGTVSAGPMASQSSAGQAFYLSGSDGADDVVASYASGQVSFTLGGNPAGDFAVTEPPDSILLAGNAGNDTLTATQGFPASTSVVLLGGEGNDLLTGGETEDALIDGAGDDLASAGGGDDAVPNNGGADVLAAGAGDDLFVSNAVCDGDSLDGGPGSDNANWANFNTAIAIEMAAGSAGLIGPDGRPECASASLLTSLSGLEDTEGTSFGDVMVGDSGPNQLLGRLGPDSYFAGAGDDSILANSGTPVPDPDPVIDCGEGFDTAQIDFPENGPDAAPVGCEAIHERAPNSFRPPDTPPPPVPPPAGPPPPAPDRTPPRTRIVTAPRKALTLLRGPRRVVFRFSANERSTFVCRLDRRRPTGCSSPRAYKVGAGSHVFHVTATDAAGNSDPSPAVFRFRVRRR